MAIGLCSIPVPLDRKRCPPHASLPLLRATAVGVDTVLSRIIRLVDGAQATKAPAEVIAKPAGTVTVATRALRSGAGTPRLCFAGCSETVYLAGIMETLTGVKAGPGGPLDPQNIPMLAES